MAIIQANNNGGFWESLGQSFIQSMMRSQQMQMQQEELKLQKDALKIQQDKAQADAERQQGADQTGAQLALLLAGQDPQMAQLINSMQASPQQASALAQRPGAVDPNVGNATIPTQQVSTAIKGMTSLPGGGMATNSALATAVPQMQSFRESQARIAGEKASTELRIVQTRAAEQAMRFAEELFPLEKEEMQTRTAANRASIKASNAQTRNADAEREARVVALARSAAADRFKMFTDLAATTGNPTGISNLLFGSNRPPTMEELIAEEMQFVRTAGVMASGTADPRATLTQLYEERDRTKMADRIGFQPADQQWVEQKIEALGGDPTAAYKAAKEAVGQPGATITQEELPLLGIYLKMRYSNFQIPPADKRWYQSLFQTAAAAIPQPGSPAAEKNAASAGANAIRGMR